MNDLRLTDTNSADDSRGITWGLEGHLLWLVLGGVVLSLLTFLILYSGLHSSIAAAAIVASLPFLLALAFAVLKQSHPPGWDVDVLDGWMNGRGFAPRPLTVPSRDDRADGSTSVH